MRSRPPGREPATDRQLGRFPQRLPFLLPSPLLGSPWGAGRAATAERPGGPGRGVWVGGARRRGVAFAGGGARARAWLARGLAVRRGRRPRPARARTGRGSRGEGRSFSAGAWLERGRVGRRAVQPGNAAVPRARSGRGVAFGGGVARTRAGLARGVVRGGRPGRREGVAGAGAWLQAGRGRGGAGRGGARIRSPRASAGTRTRRPVGVRSQASG